MRQPILLLAILIFSYTSYSQKNSLLVGGSVAYYKEERNDLISLGFVGEKSTTWRVSPDIGYFLSDNFQVGVGLIVEGQKAGNGTSTFKITNYGSNFYARYFLWSGSFRPFIGGSGGFNAGNGSITNNADYVEKVQYRATQAHLDFGFLYWLNNKVSVMGSLGTFGYQSESFKNLSTLNILNNRKAGLDFNSLGSRFNIGFFYNFRK